MAWPCSGSPKLRLPAASIPRVTLYRAEGCHLCERARAVLEAARAEFPFEFDEVGIDGNPELEARYREWLPVVEIDGERAFVYYVDPEALRRKMGAQSQPARGPGAA